jgi:hypothetical protein
VVKEAEDEGFPYVPIYHKDNMEEDSDSDKTQMLIEVTCEQPFKEAQQFIQAKE